MRLRLMRDTKIYKIIITNLVNVYFSCYPISNNQRVLIYNLINNDSYREKWDKLLIFLW